jgi:hypothetical protein
VIKVDGSRSPEEIQRDIRAQLRLTREISVPTE